jgi:hypothetical protein
MCVMIGCEENVEWRQRMNGAIEIRLEEWGNPLTVSE